MTRFKHLTFSLLFSLITVYSFGQSFTSDLSDQEDCEGTDLIFDATFGSSNSAHDDFTWTISDGVTSETATIAAPSVAMNATGTSSSSGTTTTLSTNVSYSLEVTTQNFGNSFYVHALKLTLTTPSINYTITSVEETNSTTSSSSATATVKPNPVINSFVALSTCDALTPTLTADVTGPNSASYSVTWFVNNGGGDTQLGTNTETGTGATQTVTATSNAMQASYDNGTFKLTVNASGCIATEDVANGLNVDAPPVITAQPVDDNVCSSSSLSFSATATNASTYLWKREDAAAIAGTTNAASLSTSVSGDYAVFVGNDGCTEVNSGAVKSDVVTGSIKPTLAITSQPTSPNATAGGTANFSVTVTAAGTRSITWFLNGATLTDGGTTSNGSTVSIGGETDNGSNSYTYTLSLGSVDAGDLSAAVSATITDECSSVTTDQATLPVDLVKFAGEQVKNQVELAWETASELNNDFFVIERSTNGGDFVELGKVIGAGSTAEYSYYRFVDETPLSGANYYRLKQVDFDGQFEYSNVIVIKTENITASQLTINPTASRDNIAINMKTPFEYDMIVTVTNSIGQVVLQDNLPAGQNLLNMDIRNLNAGQFNITFSGNNEMFTRRFIKL